MVSHLLLTNNADVCPFLVVLDHADMWNMNAKILDALKDFKDTRIYYHTDQEQLLDICSGTDAVVLAFWGG